MPTISSFYGMLIMMFWQDHAPPHFHVMYAGEEALIDLKTLQVMKGKLPSRALSLVREWAKTHEAELMEDWELCANNQTPKKIQPLP